MTGDAMSLVASVRKRLSPQFALDVDVSVAAGMTMIFGASGSGKTTLLRCLAGLVEPDAGRVAIGDRVLFDSTRAHVVPADQRRIGYVFQQLALFPHMSARDNIGYGLSRLSPDLRHDRVNGIARSFHIDHLLTRRPDALSGGERQRVALARSLVTDPSLLLLDEPLSALDHLTTARIIADLRTWNVEHRIPVLYVTHAHREVFALGERVLVVDRGRIVADGTPHDVIDMPVHEALAQLAGFENFFDATIAAIRADAGTMRCQLAESGLPLEVPLSHGSVASPVRIAIRAGDILLANQEPRGLSARNVLPGRLEALERQGATVVATVHVGSRFLVHLTPGSRDTLGLAIGDAVWLIIKTHSCRIVSR